MNVFRKYCLFSLAGVVLLSVYPLYMGIKILVDCIGNGRIDAVGFPQYIIPYTPICLALIVGVAVMPLVIRYVRRAVLPAITAFTLILFFAFELLLENVVLETELANTTVASWQALSCYQTPQAMRTVGNILLGEYHPAFKIHFYLISVVIILAVLNSIVGFALAVYHSDFRRKKALIVQSAACGVFIALCIFACFTAFYRTGAIVVSPVSAWLMGIFFVVFGLTAGLYAGTFLYGKSVLAAVSIPAAVAMLTTFLMYMGEYILLNGSLFQLGTGPFFEEIGNIAFAPADFLVILLSGALTGLLSRWLACGRLPADGRSDREENGEKF